MKVPKTHILHNYNAKKLLTNCQKNGPINNEVAYLFLILNEFIDFSDSIYIFLFILRFRKILKILINERNITYSGYVDTRIFRVIELTVASIFFFKNSIFINVKKKVFKIHMDSKKLINSIKMKKVGYLTVY